MAGGAQCPSLHARHPEVRITSRTSIWVCFLLVMHCCRHLQLVWMSSIQVATCPMSRGVRSLQEHFQLKFEGRSSTVWRTPVWKCAIS
eukprot:6054231-Amphidinium_carterae.1